MIDDGQEYFAHQVEEQAAQRDDLLLFDLPRIVNRRLEGMH